jgi:Glycosyltransferases involved in cell wall biogenesis
MNEKGLRIMKIIPHVSVIIPVYNVGKYIEECLDSVLSQSLDYIEVLCIDDKSTDNSHEILKKYSASNARIVVIENDTHKGVSVSRNIGLTKATGKYIYFVDADDLLKENALLELYQVAEADGLDGVLFDADIFFEAEELKEDMYYVEKRYHVYKGIYEGAQLFAEQMNQNELDPCVWRQFWRREFLEVNNLTFYQNIIHEDRLFSFLTLLSAQKVKSINKSYYIYRKRVNSITTNQLSMDNVEGQFVGIYEILEFWKKRQFSNQVDIAIHKYLIESFDITKGFIKKLDYVGKNRDIVFKNKITNILFDILGLNELAKSVSDVTKYIDTIKQYENVIVYGAGDVARRVLAKLDDHDIAIRAIAVTNKERNPNSVLGNKVYGMNELLEYKNKCVVIIAVSTIYQDEIENMLISLGFTTYIKV